MSIQKSFDILNNINDLEVLSILKKNIEKFENNSSTLDITNKTTPPPATPPPATPPPATPPPATPPPATKPPATPAPATPAPIIKDDVKKESQYKYDTEYLIKWAFIGFGIFAGILIIFLIIYYIFFSSNEVIMDNENEYNSLNYLPSKNNSLLNDNINSSRFNSKYNISKQSTIPSSQLSYESFYNDQDDKLSKELESNMSTKSLQKSQYLQQTQLSKEPQLSDRSQYFEKPQQSISMSKKPQYFEEPQQSISMTKKPQQSIFESKKQIAEPETSFFDIFSSKKTENPTTNKIVGGKKKK